MKAFHAIPLFIFLVLCIAMAGLMFSGQPVEIIDKPMPAFDYALPDDQPAMINFFASWCVPCRAEHSSLTKLKNNYPIKIYGIAYKDKPQDVEKYLSELGNPYERVVSDDMGNIFIDWGLAGVPESFIVYKGRIRYHHQGVIMPSDLDEKILPVLKELR